MRKQALYHISMMRPGVLIELHEMECLKDSYDEDEYRMWDDIYAEVVDVSPPDPPFQSWKLVVQGYGQDTYTYFVSDDTLLKVIDGHGSMYWIVEELI